MLASWGSYLSFRSPLETVPTKLFILNFLIHLLILNLYQVLDLQHNSLSSLPSFPRLPTLRALLLSHNKLRELPSHLPLPSLNSLSLSHNHLRRLPPTLLADTKNISILLLQSNKLASLPEAVTSLPLLRSLDLGDNRLASLPASHLQGLPALHGLRLEGNRLTELPKPSALDNLPTLEVNPDFCIPVLFMLQVLNLARNSLPTLPQETFAGLPRLQALRLDANRMTDINGLLTAQTQLRWLNVSSNQLQWFDYAFIPKQLEWLDLQQNTIEELGNYYQLGEGFSLTTLLAGHNRITMLSPVSLLHSLRVIDVSSNSIQEVAPNTFLPLGNLSSVSLAGNLLSSLPLAALALAPSAANSRPQFRIGGNPILCDCRVDYLVKAKQLALTGHYPHLMDLQQVTCLLPRPGLPSLPLLATPASHFLCPYTAHCFALCQCCDFFACDCRMQCPDGCTCFHDSTWTNNVIDCSARGHTSLPALIPMDATSLHLDGNKLGNVLLRQAFIGRKKVASLFLNSSQLSTLGPRALAGLTELQILNLGDNLLTELRGDEFANLTGLQELHLQHNRLQSIHHETFANLSSLQVGPIVP